MKSVRKIGGKKFTVVSCNKSKTIAKKEAAALRAKGKKVRVVSTKTKSCVLVGGALISKPRKHKAIKKHSKKRAKK